MPIRVLTWNLFHGRADPPAGRPLLREFAEALAGWSWDVALLQEVPPWWPPRLADAAGAQARWVLTSRNGFPRASRAIAARRPDLLKANGGGANAVLVRGATQEHRSILLTRRPERRVAHGVRLADGTWVVNLHGSTRPPGQPAADGRRALVAAETWAGPAPLVFGGDLNQTRPRCPGLTHLAGHHVDHLFARGYGAAGAAERLDAGALSDHRPLAVDLRLSLSG